MSAISPSVYYGIEELKEEWRVCANKLKKWLISGELRSHLWLPVMSVYSLKECFENEAFKVTQKLEHFEGFVPLTNQHCLRLFRCGELTLRNFSSHCGSNRYLLPDSSEDICARVDDLLVLDEERERFELEHGLGAIQNNETTEDMRTIIIDGQTHYFGEMQAKVLQLLHQAAVDGEPWQNGKQLLQQVGSESFTLSNVFKHKPVWKDIIESDGRGYYRLKPAFLK